MASWTLSGHLTSRVYKDRGHVRESQDLSRCPYHIINTYYRGTNERNGTVRMTNTQKKRAEKDNSE